MTSKDLDQEDRAANSGPAAPFCVSNKASRSHARTAVLSLTHAVIETPAFMPVGTQATVKSLTPEEIWDLGYRLILGNTYHLHLRPGEDRIAEAGGLHRFQGWDGALLTDSGGFQVFSLSGLRKIGEDGVEFQSHIDGSRHVFTPEVVMEIQRKLGADIIMAFDECAPFPSDQEYAREAMDRTHAWAARCVAAYNARGRSAFGGWNQLLFGIVQGATYRNLREESARFMTELDLPGYAIGGLAVGESADARNDAVEWSASLLPESKPRYLMGVGTPVDLLDAVERGIDLFDCVLPTRNARNAQVFTSSGTLNLRNSRFTDDHTPIDQTCGCRVCGRHTRAYIRHLFQAHEMLGPRLATYHNLYFYCELMRGIRSAISEDNFGSFRDSFVERYSITSERQNAVSTERSIAE